MTSANTSTNTSTNTAQPGQSVQATPTLQSDIRVLDSLLALNLDITIWSARRKMSAEDFGGAPLPPEDLASLGSKKICDPEQLRVFGTLKARAFNYLDRHGVRFMSGWAIPEASADKILEELASIRKEFLDAKARFLADYDAHIEDWIAKHDAWGDIIRSSTVSSDYVRSRLDFRWQLYKVEPVVVAGQGDSGLNEEVTGLASTLFEEIAKEADNVWRKVYCGKTAVSHKALSPLRTLHAKLEGLAFVEPHVQPVADLIKAALDAAPKRKGFIRGASLLTLQGLVAILRDPGLLIAHSQQILDGAAPDFVLGNLESVANIEEADGNGNATIEEGSNDEDAPEQDTPGPVIPSLGLW